MYASCIIQVTRAGVVDIVDDLAHACGKVIFNLLVDPLSRLMSNCSCHGDNRTAHRTAVSRYDKFGIPGRHNSRRASKRGRARPPPFRRSCHQKHRPSIHDVPVEEPRKAPPEFLPRRLARQELGLARRLRRYMRRKQEADRRPQEQLNCTIFWIPIRTTQSVLLTSQHSSSCHKSIFRGGSSCTLYLSSVFITTQLTAISSPPPDSRSGRLNFRS